MFDVSYPCVLFRFVRGRLSREGAVFESKPDQVYRDCGDGDRPYRMGLAAADVSAGAGDALYRKIDGPYDGVFPRGGVSAYAQREAVCDAAGDLRAGVVARDDAV